MQKLAFAPFPTEGPYQHRVVTPATHIAQATVLPVGFSSVPSGTTHIVINAALASTSTITKLKDAGLKIVLDLDDHWQPPTWHCNYKELTASNYAKEVPKAIKAADIVWCASKPLLDICSNINANAHYIPNAYPSITEPPKSQGQRFGYVATARSHYNDAKLLRTAFGKLANAETTAQVGWMGMRQGETESSAMRDIFELAGSYFMAPYLPASNYLWHYRGLDVALAPLAKNNWNKYKSALKGIEAGATGCAFICSDWEPYQEFEHGKHCLKAKKPADWYNHITKLNAQPELGLELSHNLQEYVKENFNPVHWANQRMQTLS